MTSSVLLARVVSFYFSSSALSTEIVGIFERLLMLWMLGLKSLLDSFYCKLSLEIRMLSSQSSEIVGRRSNFLDGFAEEGNSELGSVLERAYMKGIPNWVGEY